MKKLIQLVLIATLALFATTLAADTFAIDKNHSEASFQVRHFVTKVRGKFTDFGGAINIDQANPSASSVEFTIKATSIDTSNADRDKHLRSADFFDVEKNPEITFKSSKIAATKTKDLYEVTGTLTMHGVAKTITLPVTSLGSVKDHQGNSHAGFETHITLNRKDYGINWNRALDTGGFMLGDDVDVTINIESVLKKAQPAP
ncbi:MAG TPA: YceI family protein [Thermoanaerobaculia bacterium]|nr:YceI family protein [Thermoanaerobaculia bacterium]